MCNQVILTAASHIPKQSVNLFLALHGFHSPAVFFLFFFFAHLSSIGWDRTSSSRQSSISVFFLGPFATHYLPLALPRAGATGPLLYVYQRVLPAVRVVTFTVFGACLRVRFVVVVVILRYRTRTLTFTCLNAHTRALRLPAPHTRTPLPLHCCGTYLPRGKPLLPPTCVLPIAFCAFACPPLIEHLQLLLEKLPYAHFGTLRVTVPRITTPAFAAFYTRHLADFLPPLLVLYHHTETYTLPFKTVLTTLHCCWKPYYVLTLNTLP